MRKLMIAMLALAVVFGFAACDNSTANSGAASQLDVAYIEAVEKTATDYLVGETADPADFTFTGYDAAGNVVIEDMASTLFAATKPFAKGDDEAVFTYSGTVKVPAIKVPVSVYEIEKLTVDATADNVKKSYYTISKVGTVAVDATSTAEGGDYYAYTLVDKTGLVVTATYNGTSEKVIDADDYTAVLGTVTENTETGFAAISDWTSATLTGKDAVVRISMDGTTAEDYYAVNFSANVISSIYFDIPEDYKLYYAEGTSPADFKFTASEPVKVLANMVNGQTGYEPTQSNAKVALTASGAASSTIGVDNMSTLSFSTIGSNNSVTLYAVYTGTDVVTGFPKTAVESRAIDLVENVPAGIKITIDDSTPFKFELDTNYSAETSVAGITVTYLLADGKTAATTPAELKFNGTAEQHGYTITPNRINSSEISAGVNVEITITPVAHPDWAKTVVVATQAKQA